MMFHKNPTIRVGLASNGWKESVDMENTNPWVKKVVGLAVGASEMADWADEPEVLWRLPPSDSERNNFAKKGTLKSGWSTWSKLGIFSLRFFTRAIVCVCMSGGFVPEIPEASEKKKDRNLSAVGQMRRMAMGTLCHAFIRVKGERDQRLSCEDAMTLAKAMIQSNRQLVGDVGETLRIEKGETSNTSRSSQKILGLVPKPHVVKILDEKTKTPNLLTSWGSKDKKIELQMHFSKETPEEVAKMLKKKLGFKKKPPVPTPKKSPKKHTKSVSKPKRTKSVSMDEKKRAKSRSRRRTKRKKDVHESDEDDDDEEGGMHLLFFTNF